MTMMTEDAVMIPLRYLIKLHDEEKVSKFGGVWLFLSKTSQKITFSLPKRQIRSKIYV